MILHIRSLEGLEGVLQQICRRETLSPPSHLGGLPREAGSVPIRQKGTLTQWRGPGEGTLQICWLNPLHSLGSGGLLTSLRNWGAHLNITQSAEGALTFRWIWPKGPRYSPGFLLGSPVLCEFVLLEVVLFQSELAWVWKELGGCVPGWEERLPGRSWCLRGTAMTWEHWSRSPQDGPLVHGTHLSWVVPYIICDPW